MRSAFEATFSDIKIVKSRRIAQFIFELPLEAVDAALETLGGVPRPDKEAWVGIARLDLKKPVSEAPEADDVPVKERRSFYSLPLSQQAALRCNDADFWKFIGHVCDVGTFENISSPEGAASFVRIHCNVESRADLGLNSAGRRWMNLNDKYEAWLRERNFR